LWLEVGAEKVICAEVKFPKSPITVISRRRDHEHRFWEADRQPGGPQVPLSSEISRSMDYRKKLAQTKPRTKSLL
jgi:hypothetical protein